VLLTDGSFTCKANDYVNGTKLPHCVTCCELGIKIAYDLSQTQHMHVANMKWCSKVTKELIMIFVVSFSDDIKLLAKTFTENVRPILEYNSINWSPYKTQLLQTI